jgi:hypothetical protein
VVFFFVFFASGPPRKSPLGTVWPTTTAFPGVNETNSVLRRALVSFQVIPLVYAPS